MHACDSNDHNDSGSSQARAGTEQGSVRRLTAADIFAGSREVIVDHDGQEYRLRITASGKLILTK